MDEQKSTAEGRPDRLTLDYQEWLSKQPRITLAAETVDLSGILVLGLVIAIDRVWMVLLEWIRTTDDGYTFNEDEIANENVDNRQIPRPVLRARPPDPNQGKMFERVTEANNIAKSTTIQSQRAMTAVRNICSELPISVFPDPRGWEVVLLQDLQTVTEQASYITLTLPKDNLYQAQLMIERLDKILETLKPLGNSLCKRAQKLSYIPPCKELSQTDSIKQDKKTNKKLPKLSKYDREAWQACMIVRMTQQEIAEQLNNKYGTKFNQGQISRMIKRAKAHADASGLTGKITHLTNKIPEVKTMDPQIIDLGERTDHLSHGIRAKKR